MITTYTINIELTSVDKPQKINVVQGDFYSRTITVLLTENGTPWTIPANAFISIRYMKPDGTVGCYDTLPNGEKACTFTDNQVKLTLAPQVLTACGLVRAQVEFYTEEALLATFEFHIIVSSNLSARITESQDYINWQEWTEAQIDERIHEGTTSGLFTGKTPNLTIGKVSTLVPGASATAAIRGTAEDPILDLGIPAGPNTTIAAEGTSGDWYYRKWENGLAELYGTWVADSVTTNGGTEPVKWAIISNAIPYPFSFVAEPLVIPGFAPILDSTGVLGYISTNNTAFSTSQSGGIFFVYKTELTFTNFRWGLHVIGRWK